MRYVIRTLCVSIFLRRLIRQAHYPTAHISENKTAFEGSLLSNDFVKNILQ